MPSTAVCEFPSRLHPISEMILNYYLDGVIGLSEFMRLFSLPNSDYLSLAECIAKTLSPLGLS